MDLSGAEPQVVDRMQMDEAENGLTDVDFLRDETCVLVGFRGDRCALVNMQTK